MAIVTLLALPGTLRKLRASLSCCFLRPCCSTINPSPPLLLLQHSPLPASTLTLHLLPSRRSRCNFLHSANDSEMHAIVFPHALSSLSSGQFCTPDRNAGVYNVRAIGNLQVCMLLRGMTRGPISTFGDHRKNGDVCEDIKLQNICKSLMSCNKWLRHEPLAHRGTRRKRGRTRV